MSPKSVIPATESAIADAALLLKEGGLVAFPTETVYGLGANALNECALLRIFEAKGRPATNPLIIHVACADDVENIAIIPDDKRTIFQTLTKQFWPGPLTLVLPKRNCIPDIATAGKDSVAVRVPNHPVALKLLQQSAIPIAAPSANRSNYVSPTEAGHVWSCLKESVDCILDGGKTDIGIESTVLSILGEPPVILRHGGVTVEALEKVLQTHIQTLSSSTQSEKSLSPGQLPVHYSPKTPVRQIDSFTATDLPCNKKIGFISFGNSREDIDPGIFARVASIGNRNCPAEIASQLYSSLREFDKLALDLILVDSLPMEGLGVAIMDRIERASRGSDFTELP
jgi:L-threonylcarbamoyladenylate synthase